MFKKLIASIGLSIIVTYISAQEKPFIIEKNNLFYTYNHILCDGNIKETYPSGALKAEYNFVKGLPHGTSTIYFENGKVKEIRNFNNGLKHGEWITFDEKGNKTAIAYYHHGLKDSTWMVWDENGVKRFEFSYNKGQKAGTWLMYDEKGAIAQEQKH